MTNPVQKVYYHGVWAFNFQQFNLEFKIVEQPALSVGLPQLVSPLAFVKGEMIKENLFHHASRDLPVYSFLITNIRDKKLGDSERMIMTPSTEDFDQARLLGHLKQNFPESDFPEAVVFYEEISDRLKEIIKENEQRRQSNPTQN